MTNHAPHTEPTTGRRGHTTAAFLVGAAAMTALGIGILASGPDASTAPSLPDQGPERVISRSPQPLETTASPPQNPSPRATEPLRGDRAAAEQAAAQFITAWRSRSWETTQAAWEKALEITATNSLREQLTAQGDWESLAWARYRAGRSVTTVNVASTTVAEAIDTAGTSTPEPTGDRTRVIVEFDVATMSEDPIEQANPVNYRMLVELMPAGEGLKAAEVSDLSGAGGL